MAARPLYVSYTSPNTRTVTEWRAAGVASWRANVRTWARKSGAAFVLRANGSGTLLYLDSGRIRSKTFKDVRPARTSIY